MASNVHTSAMQGLDDSWGDISNAPLTFSANESEDVVIKMEKAVYDSCKGLAALPSSVLSIIS